MVGNVHDSLIGSRKILFSDELDPQTKMSISDCESRMNKPLGNTEHDKCWLVAMCAESCPGYYFCSAACRQRKQAHLWLVEDGEASELGPPVDDPVHSSEARTPVQKKVRERDRRKSALRDAFVKTTGGKFSQNQPGVQACECDSRSREWYHGHAWCMVQRGSWKGVHPAPVKEKESAKGGHVLTSCAWRRKPC